MSKNFNETLQSNVEDLRFFIPLRKGALYFDNAETWQECYLSEHKYKLADNYKLTLIPIDQRYCSRDFYISDFKSVLESGFVIQKTDIEQHAEDITWYQKLGNIKMVNKANVVIGGENIGFK